MKILDLINENDNPVTVAQNQLALARKELQDYQAKIREMQGQGMQAKRAAVTTAQQSLSAAQQQKNTQQQATANKPTTNTSTSPTVQGGTMSLSGPKVQGGTMPL